MNCTRRYRILLATTLILLIVLGGIGYQYHKEREKNKMAEDGLLDISTGLSLEFRDALEPIVFYFRAINETNLSMGNPQDFEMLCSALYWGGRTGGELSQSLDYLYSQTGEEKYLILHNAIENTASWLNAAYNRRCRDNCSMVSKKLPILKEIYNEINKKGFLKDLTEEEAKRLLELSDELWK